MTMFYVEKMPLAAILLLLLVASTEVVRGAEDDEPSVRSLTDSEMRMAEDAGYSYVDRLTQFEEELYAKGAHVKKGSHSYLMSKFKQPSQEVISLSRSNLRFIETVRFLKNGLGLNDQEVDHNLMRYFNEANTSCLAPTTCSSTKYRTIDGSCNSGNPDLSNLGRSVTTYRRILYPAYLDGITDPRTNSSKVPSSALPSARLVSTTVFSGNDAPLGNITNLIMQFGQFINHDLEFTAQYAASNGAPYSCCTPNNTQWDPSVLKSLGYCFPITVPANDPFLNSIPGNVKVRETCMNLVRTVTGPNRINCKLPIIKYADQLNQNTHWLDASVVYGSNNVIGSSLRNSSNGLMAITTDSTGRQLLPITKSCFVSPSPCFSTGDLRSQVQPQMTVMQTVWMREHNRIAKILSKLNPSWCGETVYQETRRIVIAEYQHITYNEFLPALLGKTAMTKYGLTPLQGGANFRGYNTDNLTSGPISNEFATAAYRMGHSLVQGIAELVDASGKITTYNMSDNFFNSTLMYTDKLFVDKVIRGFVRQHSQTVDTQVTDQLWLKLFTNIFSVSRNPPVGAFDIVSLNIQRGRDHGLPSYNSYIKMCGLKPLVDPISSLPTNVNKSDKSTPYFNKKVVDALAKVYQSVNDIDLYVGGLAELSTLGDGIMGPTFTCLIAENFKKLKYSDRYFYESRANPNPFKPSQLAEIKKASMSRIFCDNSEGTVTTLQPLAFIVADNAKNKQAFCKDKTAISSLNLNLWASK